MDSPPPPVGTDHALVWVAGLCVNAMVSLDVLEGVVHEPAVAALVAEGA